MKRFLLSILFCTLAISPIYGLTFFSGYGGPEKGYIYEDGTTDEGMRYIISDMTLINGYAFSLCKFIPLDGEPWYGLSVETKKYMPNNGFMVLLCDRSGMSQTMVLTQKETSKAVVSRGSLGLSPFLLFGSKGSNLSFVLHKSTVQEEVFYAIYPLSISELETLLSASIKRIRISERSTYQELFPSKFFDEWLKKSKEYVDVRSSQSINTILEGIN